jgi:glycyl-tRNA synthetase
MDKIVALCKRRGFIFQSSEIYGGLNGFWDYGPLGTELKRNVRNAWYNDMVTNHDEFSVLPGAPRSFSMVGIESSLIMHPQVWKCSGHFDLFVDMMVDCKECKARFRADHVATSECPLKPSRHPGEFEKCKLTEPREFNLMFKTIIGALSGEEGAAFLRPETAQGMFVNFKNVCDSTRVKIPFGIAQVGKSFRNEITPRNFTFRSREFEQMEMEFFCHPSESRAWYQYWRDRRYNWYINLGISKEHLQLRDHTADELSHYSVGTADVESRIRSSGRANSASSRGSPIAATSICVHTWKASSCTRVRGSSSRETPRVTRAIAAAARIFPISTTRPANVSCLT